MKTLICTVGLPRSGKSTWAKAQMQDHGIPIVNPDSIRLALHGQRFAGRAEPFVWAIAKTMVRSLFEAGHDLIILDATNITRKRRDEWQSSEWTTVFHVIGTTAEECLRRAADDEEIIPVIKRMAESLEPLGEDENKIEPIGATGTHSEGKFNEDDEGDLRLAIAADHVDGIVRIEFGKPVSWLGLPPDQALHFGQMIINKAKEF